MSFAEKCNLVFDILKCSNADISRTGGVDPSLISRYRAGTRHPGAASPQFELFCKGIIVFAREKGLADDFFRQCGLICSGNPEHEIGCYLLDKDEKIDEYPESQLTPLDGLLDGKPNRLFGIKPTHPFGKKLNSLMNLFGVSNIRLAKALNIDSSLISRFRNGLRTPLKNGVLTENLCAYFCRVAVQSDMGQELSDLIGVPASCFAREREEFIKAFVRWLSEGNFDGNGSYGIGIADSFLEKFGNPSKIKIPDLSCLNTAEVDPGGNTVERVYPCSEICTGSCPDEYIGTDGLRCAVIRFLGEIAASDEVQTLELYSDQNLTWLISDTDFIRKWAALMYAILKKKTPVKIIHNINRDASEMLIGIEKWLPLYMSGLIEGFYRKSHSDPWFSHTMFVAPGTAAIIANIASGTEDEGLYLYSGSRERTTYYEKQMDALLKNAKPLIKVFKKCNSRDYILLIGELSKVKGSLKKLLPSPSLATMPSGLLERMLLRSDADNEEIKNILAVHAESVKRLETELKSGYVTEYTVFPDERELSEGTAAVDLSEAFSERKLFYTPEEYSEHIKHLITLFENYRYNIIPLTENPHANIRVTVKEDVGVMAVKTGEPVTAFWFSHPLMCRAFSEYIDCVGKKSCFTAIEREEIIKYLGKFIIIR